MYVNGIVVEISFVVSFMLLFFILSNLIRKMYFSPIFFNLKEILILDLDLVVLSFEYIMLLEFSSGI